MRTIKLKVPTGTFTIEIDSVTMDYKFLNIYGERLFNRATDEAPEINVPEFTEEQKEAFKEAFYKAPNAKIFQINPEKHEQFIGRASGFGCVGIAADGTGSKEPFFNMEPIHPTTEQRAKLVKALVDVRTRPFVVRDYAAQLAVYAKLSGRYDDGLGDAETRAGIERNWSEFWNRSTALRNHIESRFNTVL